jgi:hypothetical protein
MAGLDETASSCPDSWAFMPQYSAQDSRDSSLERRPASLVTSTEEDTEDMNDVQGMIMATWLKVERPRADLELRADNRGKWTTNIVSLLGGSYSSMSYYAR